MVGWKPKEAAGLVTQVKGDRTGPEQEAKWTGHRDGQARGGGREGGLEELSKTGPRDLAWGIVGLFLRWGSRRRKNLGGDAEVSLSHTGCEQPQEGVQQALRLEMVQKE